MTRAEIQTRVREVAADVFEVTPEEVGPDASPDDVVAWDSVHHLSLVLALEEEFGVQLEPEEIEGMTSVAAIVSVIERRTTS
jgi:acyl carrier protein